MVKISYNDSYWAASHNFYLLLSYFYEYWATTKKFLSDNFNNKIISNENFPMYSISTWI